MFNLNKVKAFFPSQFPSHIPVLEDKYSVEENLAQLGQQQQQQMDIQEEEERQQQSQRAEVHLCNHDKRAGLGKIL